MVLAEYLHAYSRNLKIVFQFRGQPDFIRDCLEFETEKSIACPISHIPYVEKELV